MMIEPQRKLKEIKGNSLVSIIVPVYKVEKYLDRCINSIVNQTYKNIELILVDDGSPDRCGQICDEYSEKYTFIQVIHQRNSGQAIARNHAVNIARGNFIVFVDSDDFIEPDCVEYLIGLQKKYQTDMVIGGFKYQYEGKKLLDKNILEETVIVLNASDTLKRMNYNEGCGCTPWAKLYKKELIIRHPFPECQIYEDLATLYKIVGDCNSIVISNRVIYYWIQRKGSTMRTEFDERQMAGMDAAFAQVQYVKKYYPDALQSAKYRHTAKAVELISICFNSGGDKVAFQKLRNLMNLYAREVLRDKKAKKTMKLRIISVKMGYYPAWLIFKLHEILKKKLI